MPRITWSCLLLLVLALPLASCFTNPSTCPTCPAEQSGRIEFVARPVRLPGGSSFDTLRLDSVHVSVDGGARVTALPGQRLTFDGLDSGAHDVKIVRWILHNSLPESPTSNLRIELARGETRTIVFHGDFPLVSWSPPPAGRDDEPGPDGMPRRDTSA